MAHKSWGNPGGISELGDDLVHRRQVPQRELARVPRLPSVAVDVASPETKRVAPSERHIVRPRTALKRTPRCRW